jgi:6-pyruvoyltetrahydropterin/6-carboxytetrahydropterin synthase
MPPAPETVIHIEKGQIGFAAAHFNCLGGGRELLHGHNYTVGLRVRGEVGAEGAVIDFTDLKRLLVEECDALDHRMIVPTRCADVVVGGTDDGHVTMRYRDGKRFLFPEGDCVLLPIANATCECLAAHLLERVRARLGDRAVVLEVLVDESPGQGATVVETA